MSTESELSWGTGLMAPQGRGYVPTAYDRLRASRMTDSSNPDANEDAILEGTATHSTTDRDGLYVAGDMKADITPLVTETGPSSSSGQHKIVDPLRFNPGHEADGFQDGSGAAWRASVPPNPKR